MLVVDSSVWIAYFNGERSPETDYLHAALGRQPILVGDLMLVEVLQGYREEEDFEKALQALGRFHQVSLLSPALAIRCARNYRSLRRAGITVRKTYCIEHGHVLLHYDRDFDAFETHLGLHVVHPASPAMLD